MEQVNQSDPSILNKAYSPNYQGAIIFAASIFVMLLSKVFGGLMDVGADFCWLTASAFMLFYAVGNSVFCLAAKDINKYWINSMLVFAVLTILSFAAAYALSGMSIEAAGAYRWLMIVVVFGYLVFLSIIGFMKRIVEYAEAEDWQAPKKKNR